MSGAQVQRVSTHEPLLKMRKVTRTFPGVIALNKVDFFAHAGEVHALMGENGAGKSTLMKILTGVYRPNEGEIVLDDIPIEIHTPRSAQQHGLAIIHQELNQVLELKVFENFFLGRELRTRWGMLDETKMREETHRWMQELGHEIDANKRLGDLRVAERQLLEIARAISLNARVLIMDEPTTALSSEEVQQLFKVIGGLRAAGMAIVYISHRMDEIFRISDRITVLRDGCLVCTKLASEFNRDTLIAAMVGRELKELYPDRDATPGEKLLEIKALSVGSSPNRQAIHDISFDVRAGEIVGLAGLLGAGRTEILEALYGVSYRRRISGEISVAGNPVLLSSPRDAINTGIGFVTEDRKGQSLVLMRPILENASLVGLRKFVRHGFLRLQQETEEVGDMVRRLRIRTPSINTSAGSLSGGNQQKVVLAKFLITAPKLYLLDEPTQGIDVGAKAEIYALIHQLAKENAGVILASSEMPELLSLCDRIIVLCEGKIAGELTKAEATQEKILDLATRFYASSSNTLH